MPKSEIPDQITDHIERLIDSEYQEIQEEHGGDFMAFLGPGNFLVSDSYIKLIRELEEEEVDLKSVEITNIPSEE